MKRSRRLLPVLKIADREAQKGAQALAWIQEKLKQEQGRLDQLWQYQQEYQNSLLEQGRTGISGQSLLMFSGFSSNIDAAISQQEQQIALVTAQVEQIREQWRQRDIRHKSLQKMLERIEAEESQQQSRQEQRNHDEYSCRLMTTRRTFD